MSSSNMFFIGDLMFMIVPVIILIGFIIVFGTIIVRAVAGAKQWKRNNNSPILTVDAEIVTKRTNVTHHHHHTEHNTHHHSSTTYYATFQVQSGDRLEFEISSSEYGYLVEGDIGQLTFQGTRYQGFERSR